MISCAIRSVHLPAGAEDRRAHQAAAVWPLDRIADLLDHVPDAGVADRLTIEHLDRDGRSRGEPLRPLAAVTSHEQDVIVGVNAAACRTSAVGSRRGGGTVRTESKC